MLIRGVHESIRAPHMKAKPKGYKPGRHWRDAYGALRRRRIRGIAWFKDWRMTDPKLRITRS